MDTNIIEDYFTEINSLVYEKTTKDRMGHEFQYGVDNNFKSFELFRLPKYNQFAKDFTYENDLKKLKDKLIRHIKIESDLEKGIRIIKMIDSEINKQKNLFGYLKKFQDQIMDKSEEFDYLDFIYWSSHFIVNLKHDAMWFNGFIGDYGLVTQEFVFDLWDAYTFKSTSILSLKNELVEYFGIEDKKEIEEPNNWIKHLEFLKGENRSKEKIMSDSDYNALITHLNYLITHDKVPEFTKPQKPINLKNQSLIRMFYLIHKEEFTTIKIRESFLSFLKTYFIQLSEISDMRTAFSKKPTHYPF
jgi:hypothetical protein